MDEFTNFTYTQILKALLPYQRAHLPNLAIKDALQQVIDEEAAERKRINDLRNADPRKLSKQEVIEATFKMPELPDFMYDLLKDQGGFMTGSNAISNNLNPKDEDWCIQIPPSTFYEYTIGQSDNGYWEADGFSSVYCHRKGTLINILCFSDYRLFESWYFATELMKSLKNVIITDGNEYNPTEFKLSEIFDVKWKRVRLFRALRDISYEPDHKKTMDYADALSYNKCKECSREAINFTCKDARAYWEKTAVCERCSGITY